MKSITLPTIEYIEKLYSQTNNITRVARKLHVRETTLRKYLTLNNVDTAVWRKKYATRYNGFPQIETVKNLYMQKGSVKLVANELNISFHSLIDYVKTNRVDLKEWRTEYKRLTNSYNNIPSVERVKEVYMEENRTPTLGFVAKTLKITHKLLRQYLIDNGIKLTDWSSEKQRLRYKLGIMINPMSGLTNENSEIVRNKSIKISKILKDKYKSGELVSPIAGKTKENNETLRKISDALMGHPYNGTEETLKTFSKARNKWMQEHPHFGLGRKTAEREDRICPIDGTVFNVLKSSKRKYCGKGCSGRVPRKGKMYSNCRGGYRKDLGHYVRSSWEANFARLLIYLKKSYVYEPKTFNVGSDMYYTPDFLSNNIYYEIKGHAKSKYKWDCNCIYCKKSKPKFYASVDKLNIKLIGSKEYKLLEKIYSKKIVGWEY